MRRAPWTGEAIDLLIENWRPREIAEHLHVDLARVVDQLSEAGVEFRGKLGRESATRRAERRQGSRSHLAHQLLLARAEVTQARERQARAEEQRNAAHVELKRQRAESNTENSLLRDQIRSLEVKLTRAYAHIHSTEPGPVEGCNKVRLRDQDEAWKFAERVAQDTGQRLELFRVYPCDICPRQPIGVSRFLHITSDETQAQRSQSRISNAGRRNANGTALGDRIDPAVLERFKVRP